MNRCRHHYVPRFYLNGFASGTRQINLYNLRQNKEIQNASLRDQCYQRHFYGKDDDFENSLGKLENCIAPVLRAILRDRTLPPPETKEHGLLIAFVSFQLLRTTAAAKWINESANKMTQKTMSFDPQAKDLDSSTIRFGYDEPVMVALRAVVPMILALDDLKLHLICASENQHLITSDNPVFRYNQYCEGCKGFGRTGGLCTGLQMFIPLSPRLLLMLYDGKIYKVGDTRTNISQAVFDRDIETLNFLQAVSADQNLYFSDWNYADRVSKLARRARGFRRPDSAEVLEFKETGNEETGVLLQLYQRTPNLKLKLSFISIRRKARKVPLLKRINSYRKDMPDFYPSTPKPNTGGRNVRTFERPTGTIKRRRRRPSQH